MSRIDAINKATAAYDYESQTVTIVRQGKPSRHYFQNRRMSVASFIRIWKLAYNVVPRHMMYNNSNGFGFAWYSDDTPLIVRFGYRSTHNDYWEVYYDILHIEASQPTKRLMDIARKEAMSYYGWTEKNLFDAWLTAGEIRANTQ